MLELLPFVFVGLLILIGATALTSWGLTAWWTLQLLTAKNQVVAELKPFSPTIETELSLSDSRESQYLYIPPLLRAIAQSHELSYHLAPQTKERLSNALRNVAFWRRTFFISCGVGLALMPLLFLGFVFSTSFR